MCRKQALAATVIGAMMLGLTVTPAAAWPFGGKKGEAAEKPADKAAPKPAAGPAQPPAAPPRRKATAAERAEARRLDPLAAAAFWSNEVETDPRDLEAGVALAQNLRQLGRYEDAAQAASRVLVVDPKNVEGLLETARSFIAMKQGFYAIEPLRRAGELAPRDWRPATLSAIALEQAERLDEALAQHRKALSLAPDEPTVLTNYALFQAGQGDLAGAEMLLRRAVASPRANARTRQNLALVLGLQGKIEEAERLSRLDLPPELVSANVQWMKDANKAAAAAPGGRSWDSVAKPGG